MITQSENLRLKIERPFVVFFYRVLARWAGSFGILLLTTIGRKSQKKRTAPLVYMPVDGGFVVIAANVGSDAHPGWFLNLKRDPHADIQMGSMKMLVLVEEPTPQEREHLWGEWVRKNPGYQRFQDKTVRKFPIIILKPERLP